MTSFLAVLSRLGGGKPNGGLRNDGAAFVPSTDDEANLSKVPDLYEDEEADEQDEPTMGGGAAVRKIYVEEDAEIDEPTGSHSLFELHSGAHTDIGGRRAKNEDAMLVLQNESLYVVADGMGGHMGGGIASQLAIDAIATTFQEKAGSTCVLTNIPLRGAQLVQGFAAANEAVRSVAARSPELSSMGTTVVAARFCPNKGRVYVGHVGDSRCYRLRNAQLEQITRDHTLAEMGVTGKDAGRLSRAIGPNGIVEADLSVLKPRDGDVFLLCSDGLTKALSDVAIQEVLSSEDNPKLAATKLVARANHLGARDNITTIVVRVSECEAEAKSG